MQIFPGLYIKSTAALQGSYFEDTVILVTRVNADGAIGFVLNRPFGRNVNDLEEFKNDQAIPIWEGGPVDQEHLFFIHSRPDLIEEAESVKNGIYTGGNFKQAIKATNEGSMIPGQVRIFIGYCGWDAGDLEAEIEEGSWELSSFDEAAGEGLVPATGG